MRYIPTFQINRLGLMIVCLWICHPAFGSEERDGASSRAVPTSNVSVPYVPTPPDTVEALLRLAEVTSRDVVYDLGCGDGRVVIAAATRYGARGLGVEIDPERAQEARARVRATNLDGRVQIIEAVLFAIDIQSASVVVLYLSEEMNLKLRPQLLANMRPGSRIVSHHFTMGDWEPERTLKHGDDTIYLWRIPAVKQ